MLPIYDENVIMVNDWDDLVRNTYGKFYSFQQQDDCQENGDVDFRVPEDIEDFKRNEIPDVINSSVMGVSFEAWLKRPVRQWNGKDDERGYLHLFWYRNFYPNLQVLANDLYKRGLLPAGEYTIRID